MKKDITEQDLKEIAEKYGYDQVILVARRGGKLAGVDDKQIYKSHGIDSAPWWMAKLRTAFFKHF